MNTSVWIAVAVLATFGFAVMVCILFAVAWYAIMQMRKMQAAASEIVASLGDGSIVRLSKAVTALSGELPEAVLTLQSFNKTMTAITKLMFVQEQTGKTAAPADTGSAFYTYSEEDAGRIERESKVQAEKLDLTADDLKAMRTENQTMPTQDKLPPLPDQLKSA